MSPRAQIHSAIQGAPNAWEPKRANWPYFNVNERAGQFYKGGPLQGNETFEDRSPNGLKNIDDLTLKQNMYR